MIASGYYQSLLRKPADGYCLFVDGVNDYAQFTNALPAFGHGSYSLVANIFPLDTAKATQPVMQLRDNTTNMFIALYCDQDRIRHQYFKGGSSAGQTTSPSVMQPCVWNQLGGNRENTGSALLYSTWHNGVKQAGEISRGLDAAHLVEVTPFINLAYRTTAFASYAGPMFIDYASFFPFALSAAQYGDVAEGGLTLNTDFTAQLNQTSGTTVRNDGKYAGDGTLFNYTAGETEAGANRVWVPKRGIVGFLANSTDVVKTWTSQGSERITKVQRYNGLTACSLSTDGGATYTPLTFTGDTAIVDIPVSGTVRVKASTGSTNAAICIISNLN